MMKNQPKLVKEIDIQVQESTESPKQDESKKTHTKTHPIYNAKS